MTNDEIKEFIRNWGNFTDNEVEKYPFCFIDVICLVKEAYVKGLKTTEIKLSECVIEKKET